MRYFLIFVSIVLGSFVFAQNEQVESNVSTWTKSLTDQLDMGLVHNNQINKVVLRFCNNWFEWKQLTTSLDLVMRPNQKKDVCIALVNQSNDSVSIVGSVVPWSINTNWNMVCSNAGDLTGEFVVSKFDGFSWIVLKPQQELVKYFTLSSSDVASGKYYSCFAINLTTSEKLSANSPFDLVIRKAGNIKTTVIGQPYRYQWFDDILAWLDKQTRMIATIGIIVCGLLLVYILFPIGNKKKSLNKKPNHKK